MKGQEALDARLSDVGRFIYANLLHQVVFAELVKQKFFRRAAICQFQQLSPSPNRLGKVENLVVNDDAKLGTFAVPGVLVIHIDYPFFSLSDAACVESEGLIAATLPDR